MQNKCGEELGSSWRTSCGLVTLEFARRFMATAALALDSGMRQHVPRVGTLLYTYIYIYPHIYSHIHTYQDMYIYIYVFDHQSWDLEGPL